MVTVENYFAVSGVGDLEDYSFSSDACLLHVAISYHDGQADGISIVEIDGGLATPAGSYGDGNIQIVIYTKNLSAGSHIIRIVTNSGVLRYGLTGNCVEGWNSNYTPPIIQSLGNGTTISLPAEIREADVVLSYFVAETNVDETSGDTLLQSGIAGVAASRIRYASSVVTDGNINWSLASAQNYICYSILFRGTTFRVGGPTHIVTPSHISTPDHIVVPSHVILNP